MRIEPKGASMSIIILPVALRTNEHDDWDATDAAAEALDLAAELYAASTQRKSVR